VAGLSAVYHHCGGGPVVDNTKDLAVGCLGYLSGYQRRRQGEVRVAAPVTPELLRNIVLKVQDKILTHKETSISNRSRRFVADCSSAMPAFC
jgi:hypothetical protein